MTIKTQRNDDADDTIIALVFVFSSSLSTSWLRGVSIYSWLFVHLLLMYANARMYCCMLSNSFPKDPRRRRLWIEAIRPGQRDWEPAKSACVCSKHFALEHFNRASPLVVRLHEDAVPAPVRGNNSCSCCSSPLLCFTVCKRTELFQ